VLHDGEKRNRGGSHRPVWRREESSGGWLWTTCLGSSMGQWLLDSGSPVALRAAVLNKEVKADGGRSTKCGSSIGCSVSGRS
jgi:hypothetical protein